MFDSFVAFDTRAEELTSVIEDQIILEARDDVRLRVEQYFADDAIAVEFFFDHGVFGRGPQRCFLYECFGHGRRAQVTLFLQEIL